MTTPVKLLTIAEFGLLCRLVKTPAGMAKKSERDTQAIRELMRRKFIVNRVGRLVVTERGRKYVADP